MKHLLYLLLVCALLSSCRGSKPQTQHFGKIAFSKLPEPAAPKSTDHKADSVALDSPKKSLIQRIFAANKPESYDLAGAENTPIRLPKKFKGTINYYATGSTVSTVGKKATAATGTNAVATAVETKAPTAVGTGAVAQDFTKQGQRGGAAASGDGAQATNTGKGFNWLLVMIPAALYGIWYLLSGTVWGKLQPWLPSRKLWPALALLFAGLAYVLLRLFS
jgi:hypothetical protein